MDSSPPHVVIVPFPTQGHVKPMLMLAELLSQAGFTMTFVNTDDSHRQIDNLIDVADFRRRCPGIEFLSFPDGLPADHPRLGPFFVDLFCSITAAIKPVLRNVITGMKHAPSCIISDGLMAFANDVAEELGIPAISFRTDNAAATWTYFHFDKLAQEGEIPVLEERGDMEKVISCIPGMETIVRRRDLPTMCRIDPEDPLMQYFNDQTSKSRKASALILNTFDELESPIISHLHSIFPAVYAIGPLHTALKSSTPHPSSSNLQSDQSCLEWLDSQQPKSVLYVSFGTRAILSRDQLMEFYHGLVNSEKPFLWVIRPDLIWDLHDGSGMVPVEVKLGTVERGRIVSWAPQEEVLAHKAVGGFLTHCGWNSILESICVGMPMICRPMVVEQPLNSRYVSEVWKLGLDMKETCDRSTVEKMVRKLMEDNKEEFVESTAEMARLAQNCIRDGGSSHANLKKLIEYIKSLHSNKMKLNVDN